MLGLLEVAIFKQKDKKEKKKACSIFFHLKMVAATMAFPSAATYSTHFHGGALHRDHCLLGFFYPQTLSSRRSSVSIKWVLLLLIIPLKLGLGLMKVEGFCLLFA